MRRLMKQLLSVLVLCGVSVSVSADWLEEERSADEIEHGIDPWNYKWSGEPLPLRDVILLAEYGNDVNAQLILGRMCEAGDGVPQDHREAAKWFRKASEQENPSAQYSLGAMHAQGKGVPQDDREAVKWLRQAAEQGYALGQYNLGFMYAFGRGVPKDNIKAYMWVNLASANGYEHSEMSRTTLSKEMTKEQIAEAQRLSAEWFEKHYQ